MRSYYDDEIVVEVAPSTKKILDHWKNKYCLDIIEDETLQEGVIQVRLKKDDFYYDEWE